MMNIIKVILFILVNVTGFYTNAIMINVAAKWDWVPQLPQGEHVQTFQLWYMGGGMWVFIAAALISVGYFFAKNELKNWLLLAPMYITATYCFAVLFYFNYIYTIS